jgi:endonuclease G
MKRKKSISKFISLLASLLLMVYTTGCNNSCDPTGDSSSFSANWKETSTVTSEKGSTAVVLNGDLGDTWMAEITSGADWCSFSYSSQTAKKNGSINGQLDIVYLYYSENKTSSQREADIVITSDSGESTVLTLVQFAKDQQNEVPFGRWAELPSDRQNSNYTYVTHYVTLNDQNVRNFSLCFDKTKKAALWVAYPLHDCYISNGSRTDAWDFDPLIEKEWQADLTKSYKGNYDRGHQLPSADRLATNEMNKQTFYFSNMTPQLDRLNQDMWAQLETKVRNNRCSDTLYVVTGAYFGSGAGTTTDGADNTVPIPTHYYKVLLRTKSGNSKKAIKECSADELISIGFWVEQKSYGNIAPPASICTTVSEIEQKTGFTFFPSVDASVKKQNNPTAWGIK